MNILSLFDGMSCGQIALERTGIRYNNYFASEIDKYAIKIAKKNYPNTIELGDVKYWKSWNLPKIDLLIGGSPCQGFSKLGKQLNFSDKRSELFFKYIDILNFYKPKYFLLENVKMKNEWKNIISEHLKIEPILINSSLVSAQNRERLYWTNIENIQTPKDKNIVLKNIIQFEENIPNSKSWHNWFSINKDFQLKKCYSTIMNNSEKSITMTARQVSSWGGNLFQINNEKYRFLTPKEAERLQTLPDNYTEGVSNTQRYKMLGNGWTVDVIAHIFSFMEL